MPRVGIATNFTLAFGGQGRVQSRDIYLLGGGLR
jgi:hypothetical protein